ncbi:ZIP family metal transporter [Candidatus Nitrosocosmicus arcticus]|uniref:Putative divalent heavy-metal cations transporter n=1 Tax=Candidatus Nitrosocosmicus arcticus TaxID=2035267 RepID=A0A557SUU9_9ARCH|nr:ZIP family metal transporter [Candidatus Nitrosocosmicus arcticus]TVP40380.1 putative divalent heavy-metal cations transporter [Candidatus Nitrosocosmicus arcticus]
MKENKIEKTTKDEELGMDEENKISKTFDSTTEPGEKKLNIRNTEELPSIGINADNPNTKRKKMVSLVLAITPLIILAGMIYFLSSPYGQNLINTGVPLPEVSIEKVEFHENQVVAFIRNTGPEQVTISQADINDRIQSAAIEPSQVLSRLSEAKVIIPFFWNSAEPYEVGITTSDGTRFSKIIDAAAPAPVPNINQFAVFAMLGVFVGVIPVLIGLVWYPFLRKITRNQYNFFLSLTAGLLVFLGIDAFLESNEIAANNLAATFNGQLLIPVIIITTFLGLFYLSEYFSKRAESKISNEYDEESRHLGSQNHSLKSPEKSLSKTRLSSLSLTNPLSNDTIDQTQGEHEKKKKEEQLTRLMDKREIIRPLTLSLMVAIGIGLHNFGEGLAIGAAVLLGEIALSTFLIIGFTIHNTTEGLAIVAPLAKTGRLMIRRLILMGLIAGVPTIVGTWIGGFVYSPLASIIFLSVGAGAIFQVVYALVVFMTKSLRQTSKINNAESKKLGDKVVRSATGVLTSQETSPSTAIIAGFIVGLLIMYITGLLV